MSKNAENGDTKRLIKLKWVQTLIHGIGKVMLAGSFGLFSYCFYREHQARNLVLIEKEKKKKKQLKKQTARERNCPITGIGDTIIVTNIDRASLLFQLVLSF